MHTLIAILVVLVVYMREWGLSLQDTVLLILAAIIAAIIYWFRPNDDKEFWRDYESSRGRARTRGSSYNHNFYAITFFIVYAILKVLNSWKM